MKRVEVQIQMVRSFFIILLFSFFFKKKKKWLFFKGNVQTKISNVIFRYTSTQDKKIKKINKNKNKKVIFRFNACISINPCEIASETDSASLSINVFTVKQFSS